MKANDFEQTTRSNLIEYLNETSMRKITDIGSLDLKESLLNWDPYLYKSDGNQNAPEIVERVLDDYISASDETIFGDAFFEPIARIASGGKASDAEGVDLLLSRGSISLPLH